MTVAELITELQKAVDAGTSPTTEVLRFVPGCGECYIDTEDAVSSVMVQYGQVVLW